MDIEEQARKDVRSHKYHNLIPGQKSPQEFRASTRIWSDIYEDYSTELNTDEKRNQYKDAWLAEYQQEWDAYWRS